MIKSPYWLTALIVIPVSIVYLSYKKWEEDGYRKQIPSEIEIADAILIDGESGIRGGCGAAVFKLAPQVQEKLLSKGLVMLEDFSPSGESGWTEMPYIETGDGMTLKDRWLNGAICTGMDAALKSDIYRALKRPGSFVKKQGKAGVIVVPSGGIVALLYVD